MVRNSPPPTSPACNIGHYERRRPALIDLWKDLYIPCFDLVYPKLAEGAFVVADNIQSLNAARFVTFNR
jgi:hypothetical protein